MSKDNGALTIRDRQDQQVDSSEQYAVNKMGDGVLKSADRLVKTAKRTAGVDKIRPYTKPRSVRKTSKPGTETSMAKAEPAQDGKPFTGIHIQGEPKSEESYSDKHLPLAIQTNAEYTKGNTTVSREVLEENSPSFDERAGSSSEQPVDPSRVEHVQDMPKPKNVAPPAKAAPSPAIPRNGFSHLPESATRYSPAKESARPLNSGLHLKSEARLDTLANNPATSSLQNQGAALATAENSGTALQSFQSAGHAVGQTAGSAGASAAANAAAPGVAATIQATEKAVSKAKETIESIAASASHSSSSVGALAALFLLPMLLIAAIAGAFRGGGSAHNVGLSADVIALMPKINAACQANGIPEYAQLVAAVMMQESGGHADAVGGDVMQCAEGMGLPVGTPVSVEESIHFGTSILAANLRAANSTGPTDIPAISLALQGYNFGNGYISWALARGGYSKENAREFSEMQAAAHGWGGYGDIDYVDHVLRYYQMTAGGMGDVSAIADGRFAYPFPGHTWDTYPGHNGIDISFANCYGEPVYAVAAGTVRYTQDDWNESYGVGGMWSFGNAVFLEHGDGWISAYGHLSALVVAPGETVMQGQLLGYIGSTGNSTGPHLHLALYHNGDAGIGGQNYAELAWPQYRE